MRILEALKILETATIECKTRDIDTPEVREALDVLAPYCTAGMENHRFPRPPKAGRTVWSYGEGQQQNLRVYFGCIYDNVRQLLQTQIDRLETCYRKTKDGAVKAELDRLRKALEGLPERWKFVSVEGASIRKNR